MPAPVALNLLLAITLFPQISTPSPNHDTASRLTQAGELYYAPARHGLTSFHCDVTVDWTTFFKASASMGGHDASQITPEYPLVKYFAAGHMTVDDNLLSGARVDLTGLPAPLPEMPAAITAQMSNATDLAARMFFDFWNPLVNGTLFNPSVPGITVEPHGDGLRVVQSGTAPPVTEELFDKQLLLTEFHARIDGYDSPVKPDFQATPNGLRPQELHIAFTNPASNAINDVNLKTTYAPVSGFDLPAVFSTSIDGKKFFEASLSNCTVQATPSPTPH